MCSRVFVVAAVVFTPPHWHAGTRHLWKSLSPFLEDGRKELITAEDVMALVTHRARAKAHSRLEKGELF